MKVILYHASDIIIEFPAIRMNKYTMDFSWGFYCKKDYVQAKKWANRVGKRTAGVYVINSYIYSESKELRISKFKKMDGEWLDFIVRRRADEVRDYDIVEGPMGKSSLNSELENKALFQMKSFLTKFEKEPFNSIMVLFIKFSKVNDIVVTKVFC